MGTLNRFASRVPYALIALGVLAITGTFRGRAAGETSPVLGGAFILAGILTWGVLTVYCD
jgi:hypothetical protein